MLTNRLLQLLIFVVSFCGHLPATVQSASNASSQPIAYEVLEKRSAGTFIGNVFEDSGLATAYPNPAERTALRLSFRTPGPSYLSYFTLNDTTGILRTSTNLLDRDRLCAYQNSCVLNLEVQVLPSNFFQLFIVAINVIDINDHTPNFVPNFVRLNISESDAPRRVYPLPPVDDPDGGSNGIQSFRLEPNSSKFQLAVGFLADGSADVQLRLVDYLDRSKVGFYSLTVLAVDGGAPPRTGSLTINVTVVDSLNSVLSLGFENSTYEVSVAESLSTGSVILRVKASYQDAGAVNSNAGQIQYGIESGTQRSQVFGINSQSGEIYLNGSLDFRTWPVLLLTVSATDRTRPTSLAAYARVTVYVTDVNNNAPVVKVTTFTANGIAEVNDSAPVGSFVAYLGVTDADDGINAEVDCVINSTTFRLDPIYKDYILSTAIRFTRGHPAQYAVAVNCSDRGSPSMTTVVVVLIRVNSPGPVFSRDRTEVDFQEQNTRGDPIVVLNVTYEPPPDSKLLFGLSSLEDSPLDAISVNSTSGVVTANVVFAYDVRRQFLYVVTVSESRWQPPVTASATLVINITRRHTPTGSIAGTPSPSSASVSPAVTQQTTTDREPWSIAGTPSLSSTSVSPAVTPTNGQENGGLFKDSGSVIITAVVCVTVIVVVIIVVVATTVVCCRRNQQKALAAAAAAARLANEDSISSDGTKRLVRSLSSVSSSIASTSGDSRREIKLGSIQEESFEDTFHQMTSAEWPPIDRPTSYPDCGFSGALGLDPNILQTPRNGGLYVRSVSHPDNQNRAACRASRSYGGRSTPEDGSDTSRVTDLESDSYCSGSVTDSGRGNSLQEDGAVAAASAMTSSAVVRGSVSPRNQPPPQQVFRSESESSGSSGRPLVAASKRFPIENKIYITNHFRDALPRHAHRLAKAATKKDTPPPPPTATNGGTREEPGLTSRKPESNRSDYFDARSRASHHVPGHERLTASDGVELRCPEHVTCLPASPEGHNSRVGEFTRSLFVGHDGLIRKHHSPTRHVSPSAGELRHTKNENHLGDTFV